jgi:hypothetical protein
MQWEIPLAIQSAWQSAWQSVLRWARALVMQTVSVWVALSAPPSERPLGLRSATVSAVVSAWKLHFAVQLSLELVQ